MSFSELPHSPETPNRPNIAFGKYLPEETLTNQQIESWRVLTPHGNILTADNIIKRTGVFRRYVANEKETSLSMALHASQETLSQTEYNIDAVFVSTSFPTGENLSSRLQKELGISGFNLDIHAACSGFALSLACIKDREKEFLGKRILLVTTEKYSPHLHDLKNGISKDLSLAQTIFSDGAYTMIFEYGRDLQVLSALNRRFPEDKHLIKMPIDETRLMRPYINIPIPYPESGKFEQDGPKVFRSMCQKIPLLIHRAIGEAKLDSSQTIKMIIPHQGSGHMLTGISERLNGYSVYKDVEDGNFSSGSIPKAMLKALKNNEIKKGDILVLAGFGAGMYASTVVVRV